MKITKLFANIQKVDENDDGTITVFGTASTETVDAQGEVVTKACMESALPDYFINGTGPLRAMHQPIAAGFVTKADVDANGNTNIEATVVDANEIQKVKLGVYKGFSIGGKALPGGYDKATKTINKMRLTEISLVDRPANPEALISMWKGEDMGTPQEQQIDVTVDAAGEAAVNALAEVINKGEISPARLVELAQEEIAKVKTPVAVAAVVEVPVVAKVEETPVAAVAAPTPVAEAIPKEVKKGMYGVSRFADIMSSISGLAADAQWETGYEGDDSTVPEQLRTWLSDGAKIFQTMAVEEVNELIAALQPKQVDPVVEVITLSLADKPGDVQKADDVQKAGARNSAADQKRIQDMHDNAIALGACCTTEKHDHAGDITKLADMETTINKLTGENDTLTKRVKELEDLPKPPKAVLRVIAKTADVNPEDAATVAKAAEADKPILKADGSVDHDATARAMIQKIHQTGGKSISLR